MKSLKKPALYLLFAGAVAFFVAAVAVVLITEWRLRDLALGGLGDSFSTRIYSAPTAFANGMRKSPAEILLRLKRLSYQSAAAVSTGAYAWQDPQLAIGLRGFETPTVRQDAAIVRLARDGENRWRLTGSDGAPLTTVYLEPELVTELSGPAKIRRDPARWEEIPPALISAVIAVEDRRFFKHHGLDLRGIARALIVNLKPGKELQGGSTITQQLAKNLFLTQKRTLRRKAAEALFALYLDLRYSKERILTLYLNQIYMGQDGPVSVAGVKSAARFFFDADLADLNLSESALLAGVIRSPYRYNPMTNPDAARARRNTVLELMRQANDISEAEFTAARLAQWTRRPPSRRTESAGDYFAAEVVRQLTLRYGEEAIFRSGLRIESTMDPILQEWAQKAARSGKHQVAFVALDPATGRVLALAGGKDFQASQFNRATQSHRQPGSAFKPFVYGAALEENFTPATILLDIPRTFTIGSPPRSWTPKNYDGVYHSSVSLRQALANSMNGATLDIAEKVGLMAIIAFARKLGIQSDLEESYAMVLGASEAVPLELIAAYAPFANGGVRVTPWLIASVTDAEGGPLEINAPQREPVLEPAAAYLMTSLLQSVAVDGTGRSLAAFNWTFPTAAKTGTTNDGKDAWFIGYTADLLAGVWVGDDEAKSIQVSGAKDALPIWVRFMQDAYRDAPPGDFPEPKNIVKVRIDPLSGLMARAGCPEQKEELFLSGRAPTEFCALHAGGIRGWLQKLFHRKKGNPVN